MQDNAESDTRVDIAAAGHGAPVVLLHSSVSGNRQWKKLTALLSDRYRVVAPNLTGYGTTPAWPAGHAMSLQDAGQVVLEVCAMLEGPIRLVGHSWGGAMALWAAHQLGTRVSHVALYEPMLGGLLLASERHAAAAEVSAMYEDVKRLGLAGRWHELGRRFTDYFGGAGAWDASPAPRQEAIAAAIPPNLHEWDAASVPIHADAFAGITAKVLMLCGTESPLAVREMSALLAERFPRWRFERVPGCGHMAPISHPDLVNPRWATFLDEPGVRED